MFEGLRELFKDNIYNPLGYIIGAVLVLLVASIFDEPIFKPLLHDNYWYLPYLLVFVIYTLIWVYKKHIPPVVAANNLGILIALYSQKEEHQQKLKLDFVREMRQLLSSNEDLTLIELPNHMAERIFSEKDARKYLNDTGCRFIIWGSYKKAGESRRINAFELRGMVTHKPIGSPIREKFTKEFNETFPVKINFDEKSELLFFPLSAELVIEAVKYLLGIAQLISGNITKALELHETIYSSINKTNNPLISERTKNLLIEEYILLARFYYLNANYKSRENLSLYAEKAFNLNNTNYAARLIFAISLFNKGDIAHAFKIVSRSSKFSGGDVSWLYSYAFLYAYEGNLDKAEKIYKKAFAGTVEPRVVTDVEQFISEIVVAEPKKNQLYYILGLLNKFVKSDPQLAKSDFEKFVKSYKEAGLYNKQISKAENWSR